MKDQLHQAIPTRVLHVPGDHAYVRGICPSRNLWAGSPTGTPSDALSVPWLREHRHRFDVVHLHFGFEHLSAEELRAWLEELHALGLPLVYTAHDLRNPHQLSPAPHRQHLNHIMSAAAQVLTLTTGAAERIWNDWGRVATVVAHPPVFTPAQIHQARCAEPVAAEEPRGGKDAVRSGRPVVGIHLKDLRTNVLEPDRVVAAVASAVAQAGAVLRVNVHPSLAQDRRLVITRDLARAGRLHLDQHERFDDQQLAGYLAGLDVSVLAHRFGTHSGWLEACRDVSTRVVAPTCGFYADQWDEVVSYRHDEPSGLDVDSLRWAVTEALRRPRPVPVDLGARLQQRQAAQVLHARLYERLAALTGGQQQVAS